MLSEQDTGKSHKPLPLEAGMSVLSIIKRRRHMVRKPCILGEKKRHQIHEICDLFHANLKRRRVRVELHGLADYIDTKMSCKCLMQTITVHRHKNVYYEDQLTKIKFSQLVNITYITCIMQTSRQTWKSLTKHGSKCFRK